MVSSSVNINSINETFDRAQQLQSEGKIAEAINEYRAVLDEDGTLLAAWHQLAKLLEQQGNFAEAIESYRKAIELDPQTPFWVYRHLGFVLTQEGYFEEAIAAYKEAIALQPEEAITYSLLGQAQGSQGDLDGSIESYQKAMELSSELPVWAYLNMGEALKKKDRLEEALAAYDMAQERDLNNLGIARVRQELQSRLHHSTVESFSEETTAIESPIAVYPDDSNLILIKQQKPDTAVEIESGIASPIPLKIRVNRDRVADLYAASFKLIVAATDRALVDALQPISGISFYQFHHDVERQMGSISPMAGETATDWVELQWAPMFCNGFLASSAAGRTEIDALVEWWSQTVLPDRLPPILECQVPLDSPDARAEFWQLLFHQTAGEALTTATRLSTLQQQYMELRSSHETMHNAFAAIEGFLSQAKLPALQLAFESQPTQKTIVVEPGAGKGRLEQGLPVSSRGLAAVEFHVGKCSPHALGQLTISIESRDEATCFARWHVPYEHLTPGWFPLDLPSIDIGRKQEVSVCLEWNTRVGPAPHVSLTSHQSIRAAQIQVKGQTLDRSLALRIWTGLPGSRRSFSPYLTMEDTETALPQDFSGGHLGQRSLSRVLEVTPNLPTEDFLYVQPLDKGHKILTHPRHKGSSLARLPFCCPAGATVVKATVATENAKASTIEYAMALVKDGESPLACFENDDSTAAIAFSGWIPVAPETPRQITLSLPEAADEAYHIVFGTRRSADGTVQYGWAHWLDFYIA